MSLSPKIIPHISGSYEIRVTETGTSTKYSYQFRFPKSKKKRIRKKWAKQRRNFREGTIYSYLVCNRIIYVHPITYEKIKEQIPMKLPHISKPV